MYNPLPTREGWLNELITTLRPRLSNLGYGLPDEIRISCGFPSTRALSTSKRRVGECWGHQASGDGATNIFISPVLEDPLAVADVTVHELGHASVGVEAGHKGPFRAYMKTLGLVGKPTATEAGPELKAYLEKVVLELGAYPNSKLNKTAGPEKKQTTRMVKATCVNPEEHADPYIVRLSKKALAIGVPTCPCGNEMEADSPEEDAE